MVIRPCLLFHVSQVAWLQWAFLCIHPFGDGNGRVSRIISSLPLIKLYLPPVVVLKAKKQQYFECLDAADRSGNN
jgi:Fic family protein